MSIHVPPYFNFIGRNRSRLLKAISLHEVRQSDTHHGPCEQKKIPRVYYFGRTMRYQGIRSNFNSDSRPSERMAPSGRDGLLPNHLDNVGKYGPAPLEFAYRKCVVSSIYSRTNFTLS